jgi:hypothetical protein
MCGNKESVLLGLGLFTGVVVSIECIYSPRTTLFITRIVRSIMIHVYYVSKYTLRVEVQLQFFTLALAWETSALKLSRRRIRSMIIFPGRVLRRLIPRLS